MINRANRNPGAERDSIKGIKIMKSVNNIKRELEDRGDFKATTVADMIDSLQLNGASREDIAAEVEDMGGWGKHAAQELRGPNKKAELKTEKAKHTPGPWRLEKYEDRMQIQKPSGVNIATVHIWDDAVLIAAAPELLEALKHAAKIINGEWGHDLSEGSMSGVPQDIRAAIAKAENRE